MKEKPMLNSDIHKDHLKYPKIEDTVNEEVTYKFPWEYLADCLQRLDIVIRKIISSTFCNEQVDANYIIGRNKILNLLDFNQTVDPMKKNNCMPELNSQLIQNKLKAAREQGYVPPLSFLHQILNLTTLEQDILLICLAPYIDSKYSTIYAYLQDNSEKKYPTVNLIFQLLNAAPADKCSIFELLSSSGTLRSWHVIQIEDDTFYENFLTLPVRVDNRIIPYIYGNKLLGDFLYPAGTVILNAFDIDTVLVGDELRIKIKNIFSGKAALSGDKFFYFKGSDTIIKQNAAAAICSQFQYQLMIIDMELLVKLPGNIIVTFTKIIREAFFFSISSLSGKFSCT